MVFSLLLLLSEPLGFPCLSDHFPSIIWALGWLKFDLSPWCILAPKMEITIWSCCLHGGGGGVHLLWLTCSLWRWCFGRWRQVERGWDDGLQVTSGREGVVFDPRWLRGGVLFKTVLGVWVRLVWNGPGDWVDWVRVIGCVFGLDLDFGFCWEFCWRLLLMVSAKELDFADIVILRK